MQTTVRVIRIFVAAMWVGVSTANAQAPTLQRDLTFGCESCGGALQFSSIFEVAVSARGDMLVADRDAPLLRQFDATGKPVWTGGTKGRGPGEYQLVIRAAFLPNGGLAIVDMTTQRVTQLGADHVVVSTTPLPRFPTTSGADVAGTVVVAAEGPRGTLDIFRWRAGALTPIALPIPAGATGDLAPKNSSVAISPTGVIAAFVNNERYAIVRVDSAGTKLPDLTRTVERVRRTNEEEAELRSRMARAGEMVAAESRGRGGSGGRPVVPVIPDAERSLKAHAAIDGLRYDPAGRLWVRTMRGDQATTVFDVFNASGTFAGSVTVPGVIQIFGLGGKYLVTAGENADGIPQVTRWIVR